MKKYQILSIIFIMLLLVSGCGKKVDKEETPNNEQTQNEPLKNTIESASAKMKELSNFKMQIDMTVDMSAEGSTINMTTKMDYVMDVKNNTNYGKMTLSMMGMTTNNEMYQLVKDGKTYSYSKEEDSDVWYVQEGATEDIPSTDMFDLFEGELNYKEVTAKTSGAKAYEITLSKEQVAELMGDDTVDATIEKVTLTMEVKDGYVISMSLSMPAEQEGMTANVNFTMNFSDFNTAGNVEVPKDVINNALTQPDEN